MNGRRIAIALAVLLAELGHGAAASVAGQADRTPCAGQPVRVAVLPFELVDTSSANPADAPDDAHAQRLATITGIVAAAIARRPGSTVVDTAPVDAERRRMPRFVDCTGCDTKLARELGAGVAVTGYVHEISRLIIDMAVTVRDARTGRTIANTAVSIRGDTDESWRRGARFIARERLPVAWPKSACR